VEQGQAFLAGVVSAQILEEAEQGYANSPQSFREQEFPATSFPV